MREVTLTTGKKGMLWWGAGVHVKANTLKDTRSDEPIMKPYVEIDFTAERARLKDLQVNEVSGLEQEEDGGEGMEEEHCVLVEDGGEEVEDDDEEGMENGDEEMADDEEEAEDDEYWGRMVGRRWRMMRRWRRMRRWWRIMIYRQRKWLFISLTVSSKMK